MKYLLMMGHDDNFGPSPDLIEGIMKWNDEMRRKGILEYSNPLKPWQEAKTLRVRNGKLVTTEGSFVTSPEKVSAYALLNCESDEEAIAVASAHPMASIAVVELRPIWDDLA